MLVQRFSTFVARLYRRAFLAPFLLFAAITPALAATNSWIKPGNGNWEESTSWSLGILPNSTQDILFTNAGFKALAIGANTAHNFPTSMTNQTLLTGAPTDSFNVLLMNFSGFEVPLQTTTLTVQPNSAIYVLSSALSVSDSASISGTFVQGDFSLVHFGTLRTYGFSSLVPGSYYMTNGALTSSFQQIGFGSQFVQYGGTNQGFRTEVFDTATYQLNGGIFAASSLSPLEDGVFIQNGGTVTAFIDVGGDFGPGHCVLNGGIMLGNMSVPSTRGSGDVLQTGGTNAVTFLNVGNGTRFGGFGGYTLSNGVIAVSSTIVRGLGTFTQWNGRHTVLSNLVVAGSDLFQFGLANAVYSLNGGTLSSTNLSMGIATFTQQGGSNLISGDLVIGPVFRSSLYTLNGGFLSASNLFLNGPPSRFDQTGGTLTVNNISISNGAAFRHTGGTINHSGLLTLAAGIWQTRPAEQLLGPLLLTGDSTNSIIAFPNGSSILRFANSSAQPWSPTATLYVTNWHGSTVGSGAQQLYFGSTANGLSAQQLALIKFSFPTVTSPAKILATGEVVPQAGLLNFTRAGSTLTLTWDPGWILQSSTNVTGLYQDVPGATSPRTVSVTPIQFFRLRQ